MLEPADEADAVPRLERGLGCTGLARQGQLDDVGAGRLLRQEGAIGRGDDDGRVCLAREQSFPRARGGGEFQAGRVAPQPRLAFQPDPAEVDSVEEDSRARGSDAAPPRRSGRRNRPGSGRRG